jgi:hypothetical protein
MVGDSEITEWSRLRELEWNTPFARSYPTVMRFSHLWKWKYSSNSHSQFIDSNVNPPSVID